MADILRRVWRGRRAEHAYGWRVPQPPLPNLLVADAAVARPAEGLRCAGSALQFPLRALPLRDGLARVRFCDRRFAPFGAPRFVRRLPGPGLALCALPTASSTSPLRLDRGNFLVLKGVFRFFRGGFCHRTLPSFLVLFHCFCFYVLLLKFIIFLCKIFGLFLLACTS